MQTETQLDIDLARVPRLIPDATVTKFDTAAKDQKYLLAHPSGRRWQISGFLHNIVTHIDGRRTTAEIAASVDKNAGGGISQSEVSRAIWGFLSGIHVVEDPNRPYETFPEIYTKAKPPKNNLTFRVQLLPVRVLEPLTTVLQFLFNPWLGVALACAIVVIQTLWFTVNPQAFYPEWRTLRGPDWLVVFVLLYISYFLHEFGHLAACRYMGAKHGHLGFGLYMVFPRLYADLTDAWRLSRAKRVVVDIAGVYFQTAFASAVMAMHWVNHKPAYLMAAALIDLAALQNLNPVMKLDGYWLLSDGFGVANLDQKGRSLLDSGRRSALEFDRRTIAFIYCYFAATVVFSVFILYRVALYIPHLLVEQYPQLIVRFWRSVKLVASAHRLAPAVSALLRLLAPSGMIVGIALMIRRYAKLAAENLWKVTRRFR